MESYVLTLVVFGYAVTNPITAENIETGQIGVARIVVDENRGMGVLAATLRDKKGNSLDILVSKYPTDGIGAGKVLPSNTVWVVWGVLKEGRDKGKYILQPMFKPYTPPKAPPPKITPKKKRNETDSAPSAEDRD